MEALHRPPGQRPPLATARATRSGRRQLVRTGCLRDTVAQNVCTEFCSRTFREPGAGRRVYSAAELPGGRAPTAPQGFSGSQNHLRQRRAACVAAERPTARQSAEDQRRIPSKRIHSQKFVTREEGADTAAPLATSSVEAYRNSASGTGSTCQGQGVLVSNDCAEGATRSTLLSRGGEALAAASCAAAASSLLLLLPPSASAAILELAPEPSNALSLPTWVIHVASVVEWVAAMVLVWEYGGTPERAEWRGLTWAMVPLLLGAMCACTWHFFYNSPDLEFLVVLQSFATLFGNCTLCFAALRIYRSSKESAS